MPGQEKIVSVKSAPPKRVGISRAAIVTMGIAAFLSLAGAIISESGLSFLGLGVQPPTPTWGNMLTNAQDEMLKGHSWMAFFPGIMIFITVICMNYIGDGLRDAFDPHKKH